jgi:formylglycine-generating enzyme required for sulfatase activity
MNTYKSTFRSVVIGLLVVLATSVLYSCNLFFGLQAKGTGSISFNVVEENAGSVAKTLRPASTSMQIASYNYHLVGPAGATQDGSDSMGTKAFTNLAVGSWTATVTAANSALTVLLSGSQTFSVLAGQNGTVNVAILPLAGNGTVGLTITIPAFVSSVSGTIQNESGTPMPVDIGAKLTRSGNVVNYNDTLSAGTWRLILSLKNSQGSVIGMIIEDIDVFANITTNPALTLRDSNLNQIPVQPEAPTASAGDGQVTLSLASILGATGYNVYYKANSTTATTTDTKAPGSPFISLTPVITGLVNGTSYAFVVTAVNTVGEGAASLATTATPVAASAGGIPRSGLVAEYLFNGNALDTAGTNNGTVNGATLVADRFGNLAKAYSFNGTSSYIELPKVQNLYNLTGDYSVSCWINSTQAADQHILALNYYAGTSTIGNGIAAAYLTSADNLGSDFYIANLQNQCLSTSAIAQGQYYHFVAERSGTTLKCYANGQLLSSTTVSPDPIQWSTFTGRNTIGIFFHPTTNVSYYPFKGIIDDVRIYNRALSAIEITALYTEGGWIGTPPLVAMLPVSGGTFNNGTSQVSVSSYLMSKFEVTQAQYLAVTGVNPSYFTGDTSRPVEQVTWYDAVEFCNKLSAVEGLASVYTITGRSPANGYPITASSVSADWTKNGYRLPTEAEWEFAARGGVSSLGYTYAGSNVLDTISWNSSNAASASHPVGLKQANELGFHDMSGNVWEWCWDWYGSYQSGAASDPAGLALGTYRVHRGASWYYSTPAYFQPSYRSYSSADTKGNHWGFRVVRSDPTTARIPADLVAVVGSGQVSLTWSPSTNATSYNVFYKANSATAATSDIKATSGMITGTSATITGLLGGTQYGFVVTALNGTNESPASLSATATPTSAGGVPRNGLVAEYLFSGNANDTAGAYNGTPIGLSSGPDRFGNTGKSFVFDGSSGTVTIPATSALKPAMPLSYSVWIRQESALQYDSPLVTNDNSSVAYSGARIYALKTGQIDAQFCDGLGKNSYNRNDRITNDSAQLIDNWHHICVVFYASTSASVYIDGVSKTTYQDGTGSALGYSGGNFVVGTSFIGSIDDIRFYNRALSNSEVTALYTEGGWSTSSGSTLSFNMTCGLLVDYTATFALTAGSTLAAPDTSGQYPVYTIPRPSLPLTVSVTSTPSASIYRWLLDGVTQSSTSSTIVLNSANLPVWKSNLTLLLSNGVDSNRSATIILDATN